MLIPDNQFPWTELSEQALTTALLLEFLRWLAAWLLGISALAFVLYLVCVALL